MSLGEFTFSAVSQLDGIVAGSLKGISDLSAMTEGLEKTTTATMQAGAAIAGATTSALSGITLGAEPASTAAVNFTTGLNTALASLAGTQGSVTR